VIVTRWTATLDAPQSKRFWQAIERIPRERATAGIHALLAAGIPADDIHVALAGREQVSARAAAAVLDYRVKDLLTANRIDPAGHWLPPPLTAAAEWDHLAGLLVAAEANRLSRRPVRVLAAERRELAALLTGAPLPPDTLRLRADVDAVQADYDEAAAETAAVRHNLAAEMARRRPDPSAVARLRNAVETFERRQAGHAENLSLFTDRLQAATGAADARRPLRERHDVLTAALDLLVDHAAAEAATEPAAYLADLLGPRPVDREQADDWDRRARQVETWRHHSLGLAYGQPGAPAGAPPSERALGPIPADPGLAALRARLLDHCQATLDLGVSR